MMHKGDLAARRALVFGDGPNAASLAERIRRNKWLGENVVGHVGEVDVSDRLGSAQELEKIVDRYKVHVVWLSPPSEASDGAWVPDLLLGRNGGRLVWRMLPAQFERVAATGLPSLSSHAREMFHKRVQRCNHLPLFRVAMIGSRGVPANYGGVETYIEEVGSHLASFGVHVAVYCHSKYVEHRGPYRGMELRFVPAIRTKHLETISHTILATLDVLRRKDEVVHFHALGPSTLAWLPRLFGKTVVVTVQGLDWRRAKWGRLARALLKFGEWCSATFPHRTVVVSSVLAKHYQRRHKKTPVLIPNGLHCPAPRLPALIGRFGLERRNYILFVGRLVPEKGCQLLLQAFASVKTTKVLVVAGTPASGDPYGERLKAYGKGLKGVHFLGFVRGQMLEELYSNAYLFVHPSQMEGLSISLLEALSYGNCLLVSNVPENVEVVGDTGYTFKSGDSVDLTRTLQALLDDPRRVEAARPRARERAGYQMRWRNVAQKTMELYEHLNGHRAFKGTRRPISESRLYQPVAVVGRLPAATPTQG